MDCQVTLTTWQHKNWTSNQIPRAVIVPFWHQPRFIKFGSLPTKCHFLSTWSTAIPTGTERLNCPLHTSRYLKILERSYLKVQCCPWPHPFSQLDETAGLSSDDNAEPMRNLVFLSSRAAFLPWHWLLSAVPRTTDSLSQHHHHPKCVCVQHLKPTKLGKCSCDSLVRYTSTLSVTLENERWK